MIVQTIKRKSEATRLREYRAVKGDELRAKNANRMRQSRAAAIPEFIAVDSEGTGKPKDHRVVLLGIGDVQHVARDLRKGFQWKEVFEHLYHQFEAHPKAAFVGFYLKYDFNKWLQTLPERAGWYLFSPEGKAMRKMSESSGKRRTYYPVRCEGWEIDLLGMKRLAIRPQVCQCAEKKIRGCQHKHKPWMYICDAGPFYQMDFMKVCNPETWEHDPDGPICTDEEYAILCRGKDKRSYALLDDDMKYYNALENELLARAMERLAKGFVKMGIRLAKDEWYGPGASAQHWLRDHDALKANEVVKLMPEAFRLACMKSYFGGWFEIFSHGIIKGESWDYDINNAYPYATTQLPHICGECRYRSGHGSYKGDGKYVLVSATVCAKGNRVGPVPYRDSKGNILRPRRSRGWYWKHEIDAAIRAGIVSTTKTVYHEWTEFIPCKHPNPYTEVEDLYYERIRVGKNSAQGMSIKLNNNSLYGKFAQSTGAAPYNNWFYASFITSYCRTQILDAIATHPGGTQSLLMVATDGVYFDSPHPTLPVSPNLGDWAETKLIDLCLFKPGVYWHKQGRDALLEVKSRGVPRKDFAEQLSSAEYYFDVMLRTKSIPGDPIVSSTAYFENDEMWFKLEGLRDWPWFRVYLNFRMKSCAQAINEGKWGTAGEMQDKYPVLQSSDPHNKRGTPIFNTRKNRIDTHILDLPDDEIQTKYHKEVVIEDDPDIGYNFDGDAIEEFETLLSVARDCDTPAIYPVTQKATVIRNVYPQ
jgi:DNA polymerase type B, organellar and viral